VKEKLKKLTDYKWLIPKDSRPGMRVDAIFYANQSVFDAVEETAIEQLTNVACLPGVIEPVIGMPDMHWGYGLPMGAIGAFDKDTGIISAGCTGFDINCGIHMLRTNLTSKEVKPRLRKLMDTLFNNVPCGVGARSKLRLTDKELKGVLRHGAKWAVEHGFGVEDDLTHMEESGCIEGADVSKVSSRAVSRGKPQLGTLGAGNHFLEVQAVSHIYEPEIAAKFGMTQKDQVTIMVHCGSRGLGHQVATDYLETHSRAAKKYGIELPDRQLVCAPANSPEGQAYFGAMKGAANYAFCNRQIIAHWVRESFSSVFEREWKEMEMHTIYDVCHNICKLETHTVGRKAKQVYIHRKGSTRAFPAGHKDVPSAYRDVGQPVLIAGTMGTASYVLVGTDLAMQEAYGSSCHGAGRASSRKAATKRFRGEQVKKELEAKGEVIRATHMKLLAEEAPGAYKDVDTVVESVHSAGVSAKVARMVPLGVAKG
jgi:tRNA-splicing ligase RtcB